MPRDATGDFMFADGNMAQGEGKAEARRGVADVAILDGGYASYLGNGLFSLCQDDDAGTTQNVIVSVEDMRAAVAAYDAVS